MKSDVSFIESRSLIDGITSLVVNDVIMCIVVIDSIPYTVVTDIFTLV